MKLIADTTPPAAKVEIKPGLVLRGTASKALYVVMHRVHVRSHVDEPLCLVCLDDNRIYSDVPTVGSDDKLVGNAYEVVPTGTKLTFEV